MAVKAPRKPPGLGSEGARLWREIAAEMADDDLVPTSRERRWLEDACRTADVVADLEAALEGQARVVKGSQGQPVAHPLIAEIRQQRAALAALLARIEMTEPETSSVGRGGRTTSFQARAAAQARHGRRV